MKSVNPFQLIIVFHIATSHLTCNVNQPDLKLVKNLNILEYLKKYYFLL